MDQVQILQLAGSISEESYLTLSLSWGLAEICVSARIWSTASRRKACIVGGGCVPRQRSAAGLQGYQDEFCYRLESFAPSIEHCLEWHATAVQACT